MFADPQSVTINGTPVSMPRVLSSSPNKGIFSSSDGNTVLTISQNSTAQRFRREARLTIRKIAVDPISATNKEVSTSVIVAIDEPRWGFSDAELNFYYTALTNALEASSYAALLKLTGGEA